MDSFVDKLSNRFNAGDLIKANAEAEAKENDRLKAQADEYDKIIQEIRRLNLKTVEISEQVSQTIQCGIEQLESYQNKDDGQEQRLAVMLSSIEDELQYLRETIARVSEKQAAMQKDVSDALEGQHMTVKNLEEKLTTLRASIQESLVEMEGSLRTQSKDYEPALQSMYNMVSSNHVIIEENASQMKEMIAKVSIGQSEQQKQTMEHIHKENVKVYRNVQAVVNDQTKTHSDEIVSRLEQVEKKCKRPNFLLILTFLLALGSVAIQVAQILHLL